jgi:hypothetical protein
VYDFITDPCPCRDYTSRNQARLDTTASSIELFARLSTVACVSVLDHGEAAHQKREERPDANDDAITNARRQSGSNAIRHSAAKLFARNE